MKLLILGYESGTGQTIAARALREEAEKAAHCHIARQWRAIRDQLLAEKGE